jgi:hypothetical protein
VSYTERLKRDDIAAYGYARQLGPQAGRMGNYELDHDLALSLGGAPRDPRNLWPQPHEVQGGWGSYAKDRLELRLHDMVCAGQVSLAAAQYAMVHDWIAAYKQYVGTNPNDAPMQWQR